MTQNQTVQQSKIWRISAENGIDFCLAQLNAWRGRDGLANNPCLIEFDRSGTLRELLRSDIYSQTGWIPDTEVLSRFISTYTVDRTYAPMYNPVIPPQPVNVALNAGTFTYEYGSAEDETLWQDSVICEVYAYAPSKSMFIYTGTDADTHTRAGQYVLVLRQVTWGQDDAEPPNQIITSYGSYGSPSVWQIV